MDKEKLKKLTEQLKEASDLQNKALVIMMKVVYDIGWLPATDPTTESWRGMGQVWVQLSRVCSHLREAQHDLREIVLPKETPEAQGHEEEKAQQQAQEKTGKGNRS